MTPSVTYSVVPRKNPHKSGEAPKFYAQAQARGEANLRTMAEEIEKMCTLTYADVAAVLIALETTICKCLANGEIVRLGELGSMRLSLKSSGAAVADEFLPSLIKRSRILFRPGASLHLMMKSLSFEKVAKIKKKTVEPEAEGPTEKLPDPEPEPEQHA